MKKSFKQLSQLSVPLTLLGVHTFHLLEDRLKYLSQSFGLMIAKT